jgi:hypothetical protein
MKKFKTEGPARERWKYEKNDNPTVEALEELLNKGAWLQFPASHDDEQCIGDFLRVFKRPPEHCLWLPTRPMWKFAGPVWSDEQLARRWKGYQEALNERARKTRKEVQKRQRTDPR